MVAENAMKKHTFHPAFTIVEIIVVITVIAILAGVTLVSYGAWRNSTTSAVVKSDLAQAASTMESARTFNNGYPLAVPSTFTPSNDVQITVTSSDSKSFCLDGTSIGTPSIKYYIDNLIQPMGANQGTCATRTNLPTPAKVTNVAFVYSGTQIVVNWTNPSPNYAQQYLALCAQNSSFTTGLVQVAVYGGTKTSGTITNAVTGIPAYFCRVKAISGDKQSDWTVATP